MKPKELRIVSILQLKATLQRVSPPVWRRIHIRSNVTLQSLHRCLQAAFGWGDSHLHSFNINATTYGPRSLGDFIESTDERKVTVGTAFRRHRTTVRYQYDPGDGWLHHIVFERVVPREPGRKYPWVVGGRHACPPDDVGGVWGYYRFLEAISDKHHPEYAAMRKWYGGSFDPSRFDVTAANQALHGKEASAPAARPAASRQR